VLAREAAGGSAAGGRVLLSPPAERLLWEQVIAQRTQDLPRELLDVSALATTASQAWQRICLWGEPPWSEPVTQDVEAFRDWLPAFRARLREGRFVSSGELAALVADAISADALDVPLPAVVVAPSFERPTPALEKFRTALHARGVRVETTIAGDELAPVTPTVLRCATPSAELRTVAARIRTKLAASPEARIAVLAPDPAAFGSRLERIFEEELDPAAIVAIGPVSRRRFDYAKAPMLADYALVASALDLLGLPERRVDFETASRVLLAEFPRDADPDVQDQRMHAELGRVRRAVVESILRRERSASLRLARSERSLATELRRGGLPGRAAAFERLAAMLAGERGTVRRPSEWRRVWIDRLKALAWPGPLNGDTEGLVFRRWRDALDQFAMLEVVKTSMDAGEAVRRLREICESTPVQPPSERHSVQVLSLLDAAGFEFDAIFAIGMTATAFPPPPRPNPLLPVRWQRAQAGMPRASVEAESALAANVWARVLESAPDVVASFASSGDGSEENVASACLAGLPITDADAAEGRAWWATVARPELEPRPQETRVPALVRRGGTGILKHQSDCAFRAFSAVRLGAEKLATIQAQPDAIRRGTLVHAALEHAYGAIRSSYDLAGQSDENITDIARDAADKAIAKDADYFEDAEDLAASMSHWLTELVAAWMRHERDTRGETWEIETLETEDVIDFPPGGGDSVAIRFRPDRVDRLEDGSLVILDFKTSGTPRTASAWKDARPKEPQLPLYLALLRAKGRVVEGIAFGNLPARDRCELVGAGAREFSKKFHPPSQKKARTRADYDAAVAEWIAAVESLAHAYLEGDATVDPRDVAVCEQCGGQAFCRVREIRLGSDDDMEVGGEDDE
jgi:probable DNA repair protein